MWYIDIYTPTGIHKAAYDIYSPGGFINTINWELDPYGDCLEASFEGVPKLLNIGPGDLVNIFVIENKVAVPKFFGYVYSIPNTQSRKRHTYKLVGIKKLLYSNVLKDILVLNASGKTTLDTIVSKILGERPSFLGSEIDTLGGEVKTPWFANFVTLGDALDEITKVGNGSISWGVNAKKQLFIKKASNVALDLTAPVNSLSKLTEQNLEGLVTAVEFVFQVPKEYPFLQNSWTTASTSLFYSVGQRWESATAKPRPIAYSYVSPHAATYGKVTKRIPLILSDSWLRKQSLKSYLGSKGLSYFDVGDEGGLYRFKTNAGAMDSASKVNVLSDGDKATYLTSYATDLQSIDMDFAFTNQASPVTLEDLVAVEVDADFRINKETRISLTSQLNYPKYQGLINDSSKAGFNYADYWGVIETRSGSLSGALQLQTRRHAIEMNRVDPATENNYLVTGYAFVLYYASNQPDNPFAEGDVRIYNINALTLNSTLLEQYGASLIRVPAAYPSELSTSSDYGVAPTARAKDSNGAVITTDVQKVKYELSKEQGIRVTYSLGFDPEKQHNSFALNITNRDDKTKVDAILGGG